MSKKKDVFKALGDMYKDSVKEQDAKGTAKKFKKAAKLFFDSLLVEDKYEKSFHAEDIEYLDGYYIFGFGTNSVVHFHVKECPGWKFAIWWDKPESKEAEYINGTFFGQYEKEIDKFKPTYSSFVINFSIVPKDNEEFDSWRIKKVLSFIHKEPALAFCRDYCGWDYNEEYHSREEAEKRFDEYKVWRKNKDKYTKILNKKMLDFAKKKVVPMYKEATINDLGENWSPRYDVIAPYELNKEYAPEGPGCYGISNELEKEFDKLKEECNTISDKYEFFWFSPVDANIMLYKESRKDKNVK